MPEVDYKALTFYLHVFEFMCIGIVAVYAWLANRHKVHANSVRNLDQLLRTELNELDDRLINVENGIVHLPNHKDVAAIHRRIDECSQEVRKLEGTLEQVNNNVQMIHRHLLDKKG